MSKNKKPLLSIRLNHSSTLLLFLMTFMSLPLSVYAEAGSGSDGNIYVINSFDYDVDGITRNYALDYRTNFAVGMEITGYSNLEKYFSEKTQVLINERLFESVSIDFTVGEINDEGKYPVDFTVFIKDTWNIIAIPSPRYSSSTGFKIILKGRDYNFLGTMSPLEIDLGYQNNKEGLNFFTLMINSGIPFKLFGLYWNIEFDHDLHYRPDFDSSWYYKNTTGISVELPVKQSVITAGFTESFIINEENPARYWDDPGRIQEGFYMSSRPFISWEIPASFFFRTLTGLYTLPLFRLSLTTSSANGLWRIT